jgi:hypothetical protein
MFHSALQAGRSTAAGAAFTTWPRSQSQSHPTIAIARALPPRRQFISQQHSHGGLCACHGMAQRHRAWQ